MKSKPPKCDPPPESSRHTNIDIKPHLIIIAVGWLILVVASVVQGWAGDLAAAAINIVETTNR